MRRTISGALLILSLTLLAGAQELFPGWTAGPAAEATMEAGRRFDCSGGACPPSGLSCLHARTPADQPMWRDVPTTDLLRRRGVPWKEIEAWLAVKLGVLKPALSGALDAAAWTVADPAHLVGNVEAGPRAFVSKRYATGADGVPVALWMAEGRLNVLVCSVAPGEEDAASARIAGLVAELD